MEPLEPGKGIEFESKIVGGAVPKEYIKPVEEGIREAELMSLLFLIVIIMSHLEELYYKRKRKSTL